MRPRFALSACVCLALACLVSPLSAQRAPAESRPETDDSWAAYTPQLLKKPRAVTPRRNPFLQISPQPAPLRSSAAKADLGEKITRALSGKIQGVLRNAAERAVMIDGRCFTQGRELPVLPRTEGAQARVKLKAIENDRLLVLVAAATPDTEAPLEISVPLPPLFHAR